MFEVIKRNRVSLIIRITCLVWILTKWMSCKLWVADRLFPLIPPFDFLEDFTAETHLALFYAALSGIFLIFLFPKSRFILLITIAIELSSCLLDQNRWQPWEYQYILTILFAFFYRNSPKQFLNFFTFLLVAIYCNSGMHKLSGSFLHEVWDDAILSRFFGLDKSVIAQDWLHYSGVLFGLLEIISALGIMFLKRKKVFALLLIALHIFTFVLISPAGLNHEAIMWPWHIAMIILLYVLFFNQSEARVSFYGLAKGANFIPFVVIGILPLLSFFGMYDDFLSFNSNAARLKQLKICIKDDKFAQEYAPFFSESQNFCSDGIKLVDANQWALKEMNVPVYPEARVYKEIVKQWKKENPFATATFHICQYPFKSGDISEIE